jgi:hypothetical protein
MLVELSLMMKIEIKSFRAVVSVFVTVAVFLTWFSHAAPVNSTDESLNVVKIVMPAVIDSHGHSHDGDSPVDKKLNHNQEHNAVDHSHEIPGLSVSGLHFVYFERGSWSPAPKLRLSTGLNSGRDRPPRHLISLT